MDEQSLSTAEATFQDYLSASSLCWHPKREFIIAYGVDLETEARLTNSEATPIWGLGSAVVIMGEGASGFDFCSGWTRVGPIARKETTMPNGLLRKSS